KGIAVTATTGSGAWQYFNGASWIALGTVAENSARLLPDTYLVRFLPGLHWSGQASLTFRAWDRTTGQVGQLVDLSGPASVGGFTSFSAAEMTSTLDVLHVNHAPV